MQQRRDEILAKKAKLAELKRQRELRASSQQGPRSSLGNPSDSHSPLQPGRNTTRADIDVIIRDILGDRPASTSGANSPAPKGSRPNSVLSAGEISNETSEPSALANGQPQVLTTVALTTIYETPPSPVKEIFSYSKGVQTTEEWTTPAKPRPLPDYSDDDEPTATPSKRLSRRERDREEEIRQKLRREIEDELRATKDFLDSGGVQKPITSTSNFAARTLTTEELNAVTHSDDFVDFLDRSTKVIEKALGEYDILTDYTVQQHDADDEEGAAGGASGTNTGGKGRRKIREVAQFFDERWSRKRMVSSIDYSPKYRELLLASYTKNPSAPHEPDGVVQVWNMHLPDRPELVFHAQSDILTAKFSPFHPNLIVGGAYSGQVLLWDTRSRSPAPVQKTPLTGSGHTHPVYSVEMVGTQNANNIISVSTDGAVCGWSVDMLAQPQESLTLAAPPPAKTEDLSPTCMAFPQADPTFFLVGSEEGTIFPCHRYDRAGAKAGVDARVAYKGHAAPVMSVDFHPARGPVDLGDLVLSSSLDWSVKLWKVRAPAATSGIAGPSGTGGVNGVAVPGAGGAGGGAGDGYVVAPLMEFVREDVVYDARWSPTRPGVFALVDGGGWVEVWDLTVETEEPVARIAPSQKGEGRGLLSRSLNKVAWEAGEGKRLAVGGIDGVVSVFEVGVDLGGKEGVRSEEWTGVKKLVARVEGGGANGVV